MRKERLPRYGRIVVATISILLAALAFGTGMEALAGLLALQLGADIARLFAVFSIGILAVALLLLAGTFLFGRFYCAVICPLGILQDFLGWLSRRRAHPVPNYRKLRYGIAALAFGLLIGGWAIAFRLLEPFSNFGAITAAVFSPLYTQLYNWLFPDRMLIIRPVTLLSLLTGLIPLAALFALVLWRKRFYCTAICPVGTLLGLCSARGLLQLRLTERCVKCGQCVEVCPAGCIDPANGALDNERCLRCLNCLAACRPRAIRYGRPAGAASTIDPSRRDFLVGGTVGALALLGAGAGWAARPGSRLQPETATSIYPPGAGSAARFASKCTSCQLCVTNCRGNVLRPAGIQHGAIHLEFDRGMCEFNCNRCGEVYPTGALLPLTLAAKQRCRIGLAQFDPSCCVAVQDGTDCGACAEHCPTGALRMKAGAAGVRIPQLTAELCIGCGSCEYPCPVRPVKAIRVFPVPIQVEAADPVQFFRENAPKVETPADQAGGEWLI